jgi:hypothetical protein
MSTAITQAASPVEGRVRRPWALVLLALIVLAAAIDCYRVLTIRPVLWKVLIDFEADVPVLTHFVRSVWFLLLFPALAVLAICLEVFRYRRATLVNALILVAIYLLWQLFVEGMITPFLRILDRLAG